MKVIVDTREQLPLWDDVEDITRLKLDVGDYTTVKLLNKFHIERKSPADLYGSILKGHDRFVRMFLRAIIADIQCPVYIECPKSQFYSKSWWEGWTPLKCKSEVLEKIINTMTIRYNIEFIWCLNKTEMTRLVHERLKTEETKL